MPSHHPLGGHQVPHGVALPNGLILDQPIDDNFYHDQEPHGLDERMMNNFRQGAMGNFNQSRLQTPFDQMNQQYLQSLAGHYQQPHAYMDPNG